MNILYRSGLWMALLSMMACASGPTVVEIRQYGRSGDTSSLMKAWDTATRDDVRIAIIEAYAQYPEDPAGRKLVLQTAETERSPPVRAAAIRATSKYTGPDVIEVLIKTLGHPWPESRELARSVLTGKGPEAHSPLLEAATTDTHPLVRAMALKLLAAAALTHAPLRPSVEDTLLERLGSDDAAPVREQAAKGLGQLKVAKSRNLLADIAKTDPDASVRLAAGNARNRFPKAVAERIIVAVLPLKDDSGGRDPEAARLGRSIADYVAARLSATSACEVVNREKVQWALSELKKVGQSVYDGDAPNVPEIGRFKMANQLVYGSVQRQGGVYTLVLNRMDVATLALVPGASATIRGYKADLDRMKVELTDRFVAKFR